ncbi:unnamed protein product [Blepharisma stoltei]|uniref:TmcB/TmcC TPR repeats domain-containing protein n=1 Tax=Blepharisma stoltei TaxID=1481888 RepID=A0AAU9JL57_9CILI|nr:unnamed protein product [Blepharisma stoltei]
MNLDSKEDLLESNDALKFQYKKSSFEKQKSRIFKLFGKILKAKYNSSYKLKSQIAIEVLLNAIISLQLIALAWYPNMSISGWSSYSKFWDTISIFNISNFCGTYEITDYCFHGIASILCFCLVTFLGMFFIGYTKYEIPRILFWVLRNLLLFCVTVLYIPSLIELTLGFKYSTFSYEKIGEYPSNKNSEILNKGSMGTIMGIILIPFLVFIAYFWELFTTDTKHILWDKDLNARSHSAVDLKFLAFKTLFSICYILIGNDNIVTYQMIFMVFSFWIFLEYLMKLPYYNIIENSIKSCKLLLVSVSLLAVLLGTMIDNAGIICMLSFFVQPVMIIINCCIIYTKYNYLKKSPVSFQNQLYFERTIRHLLCSKNLENKFEIIDYFTACYTNKRLIKDKLIVVWEVNYCVFSMKNERLGRIKLAKASSIIPTVEGDIQEWIANKIIDKRDKSSIDSHYIEYLENLHRVKHQDEEICYELIDLWSELWEKNPKYDKLFKFATRSAELLTILKELYAKLIKKHKHLELFDLYVSFLESILGEIGQANVINRFKSSLNHQWDFTTGDESKVASLEESLGIILISANESSFGLIAQINARACQMLKGTASDLIGTHLSYYIPYPYLTDHDDYMRQFYTNYSLEEITHMGWFFLKNARGFLIECGILIKLSAFHSNAYFLVSLAPRNSSRQLALISENGIIQNYTELFPHYIGTDIYNIRGYCISEFIPGLEISEMELFEPFIIENSGREIAIIHIIKQLRTTTIHMLVVSHTEKEIQSWKNRQEIDQIEYLKKIQLFNYEEEEKLSSGIAINHSEIDISVKFQKTPSFTSIVHAESNIFLNESPSENFTLIENNEGKLAQNMLSGSLSNVSTSNFYSSVSYKCIETLSRNLKHYQWILVFCIMAVIGTNIAILGYIYQDANHTNSLNVFSHFGNLMFYLVDSADLARSLDSEIRNGIYNLTRDRARFNSTINELKKLREFILSDYEDWRYCSSSDLIIDNLIPVWTSSQIKKYNFYDEVDIFIQHGESLLDMIDSGSAYSTDEAKFFGLNSFGYTYEFTHQAMLNLRDCEVDRVKGLGRYITAWIFIGTALLGIFIGVLIVYVIYMNHNYDKFWEFFKKNLQVSYIDLRIVCVERLWKIHGIDYKRDYFEEGSESKDAKAIKSKMYVRYILRLSIFLIIALTYYIILKYYLYDQCESFLINRPNLLIDLISKRTLLSRMSVFARDISSTSNIKWFPNTYGVANSNLEFTVSNEKFKAANSQLRNTNFLRLIQNDMKAQIFEGLDTTDPYLRQGTYAASNIAYIDAKFASNPIDIKDIIILENYISIEVALQSSLGVEYDAIDHGSKQIINHELNLIIYVTVAFSLALVLVFTFFYLPFIFNEKKSLIKLKVLMSIVPNSKLDSKAELIK